VRRGLTALSRFTDRPEIVVIDDGSTDGMPFLADRLAAESAAVRVIHNPVNLGVGISVLIGMHAATGDLVVHDAMDYPFDLADLERVLPLFPDNDVVIVVRTDRSAHSPWRKLTSWVNWALIRVLFRVPFRDMNFVQVYKREVLHRIRVRAKSPAFVTPELLIRACDMGFRIAETRAPFHPRERGQASYGRPRDILWTLADMISFWLERTAGAAGGAAGERDHRARDGVSARWP
jgi:glycosyltransferase involved in cell wall biosynthesis